MFPFLCWLRRLQLLLISASRDDDGTSGLVEWTSLKMGCQYKRWLLHHKTTFRTAVCQMDVKVLVRRQVNSSILFVCPGKRQRFFCAGNLHVLLMRLSSNVRHADLQAYQNSTGTFGTSATYWILIYLFNYNYYITLWSILYLTR